MFFISDNRSPTDRPEHFAHPNGTEAMARVWVAPGDPLTLSSAKAHGHIRGPDSRGASNS